MLSVLNPTRASLQVGILQALEVILSDGGQPKRTLYVAFGHDEEVGLAKKSNFNQKVDVLACSQVSGHAGAGHVAADLEKMLQQREERLDFLLDEGMFVMQVS